MVFIFSGFVKAVDPWGTAIKTGEYLAAFGMEWLKPLSMAMSVGQSTIELALGIALLVGLRKRLTALVAMLFMIFFTLLTLWIAIANPVADCGCFGDAVKLTAWETFFKNLVLLPMSIIVYGFAPKKSKKEEWLYLGAAAALSLGVCIYSLRHLPIIDFLPYKVGTSLIETHDDGSAGEIKTTLIYRELATDQLREFTLEDTLWQDTTSWEYVDTIIDAPRQVDRAYISDFSIYDTHGSDITGDILHSPRPVMLVCLADPAQVGRRCAKKLTQATDKAVAEGYDVIWVTPVSLDEAAKMTVGESGVFRRFANIDATLMKTLIRAKAGAVWFENGVITDKRSCTDL